MESASKQKKKNPPVLQILTGTHKGKQFRLLAPKIILGRQSDCDVVFKDNPSCSRRHAKISYQSGSYKIESLNPGNPVLINDRVIDSHIFQSKDKVTIGNIEMRFLESAPSQALLQSSQKPLKQTNKKNQKILNPPRLLLIVFLLGGLYFFMAEEESQTGLNYSLRISISGGISDRISLNEKKIWRLGRAADSDIVIDYSGLEGKHLEITRDKKDFYVEDLGSSSKTFLNGSPLPPKKATLLKANDRISVSELQMVFEVSGEKLDLQTESKIVKEIEELKKLTEEVAQKNKLSPNEKAAGEAFLKGFRDYRKGYFQRALKLFRHCLTLHKEEDLCQSYSYKAERQIDRLIQKKIRLGKSYKDNQQYKACQAAFKSVEIMIQDSKNLLYKEARANRRECEIHLTNKI